MNSSTGVVREPLEPQHLRRNDVAEYQEPVLAGVGPGHAVPECLLLKGVAAVPGHERFHDVGVGHNQAGGQHHLGGILQVAIGNQSLQSVGGAQRNRQRQHHGKARVDGARDEVRREKGAMPSRNNRHCEVEADYVWTESTSGVAMPANSSVDVS